MWVMHGEGMHHTCKHAYKKSHIPPGPVQNPPTHKHTCRQQKLKKIDTNLIKSQQPPQGESLKLDGGMYTSLQIKSNPCMS